MIRRFTLLFAAAVLTLSLGLPAAHAEDMGKKVFVRMDTTMGPIVLELWPDKAPETVRNFLKYVLAGFYEGTVFHRVHSNFMIQGGGFDENLVRKEGALPPIKNEADNGLKNDEYTIAMARSADPDSATNEFFINVVNNKMLNFTAPTPEGYGYCVFGQVAAGKATVDKIKKTRTRAKGNMPFEAVPVNPVVIERVSVLER